MLRPSPNHGTQRLPNDDDDDVVFAMYTFAIVTMRLCGQRNRSPK